MSPRLSDAVRKQMQAQYEKDGLERMKIESALNRLFLVERSGDEQRSGLHASALMAKDEHYCPREQLLSLYFPMHENKKELGVGTLRIFREGVAIHEKWQQMMTDGGIALACEARALSEEYMLSLTPDVIVEIGCQRYILEIKSMNTFAFKKMTYRHPGGNDQSQIYMHFYGIPKAIILVEDKNTQEIKTFIEHYDAENPVLKKVIARLEDLKEMRKVFEETGVPPKRECWYGYDDPRAAGCPMRDACYKDCGKYE